MMMLWRQATLSKTIHAYDVPVHAVGQIIPSLCRKTELRYFSAEINFKAQAGVVCKICRKRFKEIRPTSGGLDL